MALIKNRRGLVTETERQIALREIKYLMKQIYIKREGITQKVTTMEKDKHQSK